MKKIDKITREDIVRANGKPVCGIMDIDSRELYVEAYGSIDTPAIAFLHGGPGTSCVEQREMAMLLGERYFVVSFDQYGVFRSGALKNGDRFGMKEHIDQMERLRETLGISSWSLLGHSYGGMLVCFYSYYYPESIDVAMYENPSWNMSSGVKGIAQYYIDRYYCFHPDETEGLALAQEIIKKDYTGRENDAMWDILKAQSYVKDKRVTMYMESIEPHDYFDAFEKCYQELEMDDTDRAKVDEMELSHLRALNDAGEINEDHHQKIAEIKLPSLLICGRYDPVCPEKEREFFRRTAPNGKVVILEHSAHHPRLEDKDGYLKAVFTFMTENVKYA